MAPQEENEDLDKNSSLATNCPIRIFEFELPNEAPVPSHSLAADGFGSGKFYDLDLFGRPKVVAEPYGTIREAFSLWPTKNPIKSTVFGRPPGPTMTIDFATKKCTSWSGDGTFSRQLGHAVERRKVQKSPD